MSGVEYELMAPAEVLEAKRTAPLAFVPLGPIEWHGPHLPLGTDALHAHHVAVRVARQVGGVVLPTLFLGTETVLQAAQLKNLGLADDARVVGMDFPAFPVRSLYVEESVFGVAVREVVRLLVADGYRLIVLVNGHGATNHMRALERIAREECRPEGLTVISLMVWVPPAPPHQDPGHAGRGETAIMLAIAEEHVHLERLPPAEVPLRYEEFGIVDGPAFDGNPTADFTLRRDSDPRSATREEGEQILEQEVDRAVERVRAELARW